MSTFGPSAATTRRLVGTFGGVEHVEVLDQHVVGLAVLLGVLGMTDTDAEQEPARVGVLDAVIRLGDLFGRAVQTLTMPVATCSVSVCSRSGSTYDRSAAGDPPIHTAP